MSREDIKELIVALKPERSYTQVLSVAITVLVLIAGASSAYTRLHTNQQHMAKQFEKTEKTLEKIDAQLADNHDRLFAVERLIEGLYEEQNRSSTAQKASSTAF